VESLRREGVRSLLLAALNGDRWASDVIEGLWLTPTGAAILTELTARPGDAASVRSRDSSAKRKWVLQLAGG
jgi:hypothetical protein